MKNIYCLSYKASTNLGDEIQTLAALNVLKKLGTKCAGFVDRDNPQITDKVNLLPYINKWKIKYFKFKLRWKIKWYFKYRKHLKNNIDWDPQPINIEDLKKQIIKNTGEQIKKLAT
ncbi:MAG: hypothetical protein HAW61_02805 [Candidatus Portiera sp.]|nr:hypothetical protein [Portiera sp.]